MKTKQLFWLLGGLLCLSLGITLYTNLTTEDTTRPAAVDDKHCPECGRELPSTGGECAFCKMQRAADIAAGKRGERPGRRWTGTHYFILFLITFLTVGGGYLILRSVKPHLRYRTEAPPLLTRCLKCKRKIRYAPSQVGRNVLCPSCKWSMTLPVPKE